MPLVLHGSSGVSDERLQSAVAAGMTKINIATHLNVTMTAAVREALNDVTVVDPHTYLGSGRRAIETEVARVLGVIAN